MVGRNGCTPDPKKVDAIAKMLPPEEVVILGSQCALRHSASLRSAHWSSITTSPRSAQLVSQNL